MEISATEITKGLDFCGFVHRPGKEKPIILCTRLVIPRRRFSRVIANHHQPRFRVGLQEAFNNFPYEVLRLEAADDEIIGPRSYPETVEYFGTRAG